MSASPTVTVAVPFYNDERTLLNTIRSVFAQTFDDWELILTDDGSTDGSLDIALSVRDSRVRVFSDGRNLKVGARRNQITREAAGKYIAVLDADDLMRPDRLEKQVRFLKQHPEVDVLGTSMYNIDSQYNVCGISVGSLLALAAREFEPWETLGPQVVIHPTATGKAQWFRENPYDETWARFVDSELWCRTCRHSKFAQINESLSFYDVSHENFLAKRFRGLPFKRRLLWTYGPEFIGWAGTLLRVGGTYIRYAKYVACNIFDKQDVLVQRCSRPLTPEQREEAQAALEKIMNTEVPMASPD